MVITRAAIMFSNGEVVEGRSYSEISTMAGKLGFNGERIYGFVTSSDEFVLPKDAAKIAKKAGQIKTVLGGVLTPEMLWPVFED
jgi:hypothetical protein